jgi:hypothetical protein
MREIARAIGKLEGVERILIRILAALACSVILLPHFAPIRPSLRDGRVYAHQISTIHSLYQYHQVVYLTKTQDLLLGPVAYALLAAVASIEIFVGYKLRKLEKRRDDVNRTCTSNISPPQVSSATRPQST